MKRGLRPALLLMLLGGADAIADETPAPTPVERFATPEPSATPTAVAPPAPIATPKPVATKVPPKKAKSGKKGAATKALANSPPVAPGTTFKIVAFGENDPLAADATLIGIECVADGFLLRYQAIPFHYGQAKCGPDGKSYDLLSAKIEVLARPTPAPTPAR